MDMDKWVARRNIATLRERLEDGKPRDNEAELRRQLAEQEAILRTFSGPARLH